MHGCVARHRFHLLGFEFPFFFGFGCRVPHILVCLLIHNAWMFNLYIFILSEYNSQQIFHRLPILATPKTPSVGLQLGTPQPQTATPLSSRTEAQSKAADDSVPATPKGDLAAKRAIPSGQFVEVNIKRKNHFYQ